MQASVFTQKKRLVGLSLALIACLLLLYFFLKTPDPLSYISSPDAGNQTAGAQQIRNGGAPFVDWRSTYGPLRFYLSYVAASVGRQRVGSELVLGVLGNTLSYLLFFSCALRVSGRGWIAAAVTAVAVVLMPPFTKFYIALCPLLALHQTYSYLVAPSAKRIAAMAAAVVFAAAYRVDVGLWALAPCVMALWLQRRDESPFGRVLAILLGWIACFMLPWLLYLTANGALWEYLVDSTYYGLGLAEGLSVPYPRFSTAIPWSSVANLAALSFAAEYIASALLVIALLFRFEQMGRDERAYFCVTVPIAVLAMLQTTHRSDFWHLLQGLTFVHLLLAFNVTAALRDAPWRVAALSVRGGRPHRTVVRLNVVAVFASCMSAALLVWWGGASGTMHAPTTLRVNDWATLYNEAPAGFLRDAGRRYTNEPMVQLISRIRAVVPPGTPFFAAPYLTNLYTMTERNFASRQMYLAPGYFNDRGGQTRLIDGLIAEHCPPVVEPLGASYDGLSTRTNRSMAPVLFKFIEAHYTVDPTAALPVPFILWRNKTGAGNCGSRSLVAAN